MEGKHDEHERRIKSAMILFRIEASLGDLVNDFSSDGTKIPSNKTRQILERDRSDAEMRSGDDAANIVSASYISELLDISIAVANDRPEKKHLKRLRELINTLDIFSVRNAIAHPNRPFPEMNWYRVSAIALDPVISELGFERVTNSFHQARAGNLNPPPEDWMSEPEWSLPNNLPSSYDHDITGLIGREEESEKVKEMISSPRVPLLSIVARGGMGKTALLLDVLDGIVSDPDSLDWIDKVVYLSSKTERLTPQGVVRTPNPASTLTGLKQELAELLSEGGETDTATIIHENSKRRILLCLDNLETLLRDSPNEFSKFYYSLPETWSVVVTSRIPVDGAATVSLEPLNRSGAEKFGHVYASRRGYESISHDDVIKIVEATDRNPLAIRLSIDSLITGGSIDSALGDTKKKIVQFSYKNLINHISGISKDILECMFVSSKPVGRTAMVSLLDEDIDAIAEGLADLMRTSLCKRIPSEHDELYEISSSVRDLLMVDPANEETRKEIEEKRRKMRQEEITSRIKQDKSDSSRLSLSYLSGLRTHIHHVATGAIKAYYTRPFDRSAGVAALERLRSAMTDSANHPELQRLAGALMVRLGDRENGKKQLKSAAMGDPFDAPSALLLSQIYRKDKEYDLAQEIAQRLIDDGWGATEKAGELAREAVKAFYLPQIWSGATAEVIRDTKDWEKREDLQDLIGSLHADALHNAARYEGEEDKSVSLLVDSLRVYDSLLRKHGYSGYLVDGSVKALRRADSLLRQYGDKLSMSSTAAKFIDRHLINICQYHKQFSIDSTKIKAVVDNVATAEQKHGGSALQNEHWQSYLSSEKRKIEDIPYGVETSVTNIPRPKYGSKRPFLFVTDIEGESYFLHKSAIDTTESEWQEISVGDKIAVVSFDEPAAPDKLPEVTTAWYLDDRS